MNAITTVDPGVVKTQIKTSLSEFFVNLSNSVRQLEVKVME